jgi:hypothetical protein
LVRCSTNFELSRRNDQMRIETAQRELQGQGASESVSRRRVDALVAAYIHELSPRHRAEREARKPEPGTAEART